MESKLAISAFVLLTTSVANAQLAPHQYVCLVQHVASLHYDEKNAAWSANEAGPGRKYTLRRLTEEEKSEGHQFPIDNESMANWGFFRLGDARPLAACIEADMHFSCNAIFQSLNFDSDTGRFETASLGGFIEQGRWERLWRENPEQLQWMAAHGRANDPSHPSDLVLEIGECGPS
jgi:hypothetical protein